jgi:hypothetical protein
VAPCAPSSRAPGAPSSLVASLRPVATRPASARPAPQRPAPPRRAFAPTGPRASLLSSRSSAMVADWGGGQRWEKGAELGGATKTWLRLPFGSRQGLRHQLHTRSRCHFHRLGGLRLEPLA